MYVKLKDSSQIDWHVINVCHRLGRAYNIKPAGGVVQHQFWQQETRALRRTKRKEKLFIGHI